MNTIELLQSQLKGKKPFKGFLIAIDPGETTGVAYFKDYELVSQASYNTSNLVDSRYWMELIARWHEGKCAPHRLVIEDYRVYAWKTKHHAWSNIHTARVIGAVEYFASYQIIPLIKQSAQHGKSFWTDERLEQYGYTEFASRHSKDAVRHGLHWLTYGYPKQYESAAEKDTAMEQHRRGASHG